MTRFASVGLVAFAILEMAGISETLVKGQKWFSYQVLESLCTFKAIGSFGL